MEYDVIDEKEMARWEKFENSAEHEELSRQLRIKLLSDPDRLFEALSADGVQYPFTTSMFRMTPEERQACRQAMSAYDDTYAARIAKLVDDKDWTELGRLVGEQLVAYVQPAVEDRILDCWKEWAE